MLDSDWARFSSPPPLNFDVGWEESSSMLALLIYSFWYSSCSGLLYMELYASNLFLSEAGVVQCGGRKMSPRTSTIVQFILYFDHLRSAIIF